MPSSKIPNRVKETLNQTKILHLTERRITTLSNNERQRVTLTSALALRPRLVVLDEPTSQLDADGAARLLDAAMRLSTEGHGVVVSEHRLEQLVPAATGLVLVRGGTLEQANPTT